MLTRILYFIAVCSVAVLLPAHRATAGPLTEAQVTKVINRVSLVDTQSGERPAVVRDVVKDDLGIETGVMSRSELLFQDNTLTRLGAETFFSFKTGTRDLTLEKGSMLLQVPKGLGGAKIHTAAVTAAITGTTIMMEYVPTKYIKVLVLEGSLRLSRNGMFGDSVVLTAGKMVIMRPDAKNIPDAVDVDLQHIMRTSTLVNFPGAAPLPSTNLIQTAIQEQQQQLAKRNLVPTNLVIGKGTNVVVATNDQLAKLGLLKTASTISSRASLNTAVSPVVNNAATTATSTLGSTVGAVNTTLGSVIGSVNTSLSSTAASLPGTTSGFLATATGTVASIPVSSTNQIGSLLQTAVPAVAGSVAVVPPTITPTTVSGAVTATTSTVGSTTGVIPPPTTLIPAIPTTTLAPPPTPGTSPIIPSGLLAPATNVPTGIPPHP